VTVADLIAALQELRPDVEIVTPTDWALRVFHEPTVYRGTNTYYLDARLADVVRAERRHADDTEFIAYTIA
jgi:hypothetical protein